MGEKSPKEILLSQKILLVLKPPSVDFAALLDFCAPLEKQCDEPRGCASPALILRGLREPVSIICGAAFLKLLSFLVVFFPVI